MTQVQKCPVYARLETEIVTILEKVKETTASQLAAFHAHDNERLMRLDKELERSIGEKERTLGALRQHVEDHKCWPPRS